jgi:hypothetical protein
MKIYIPPMPETVVSNTPLAESVLSEPEPVAKPQPKPLTVSEISEKLRAAEADRREPEAVETVDAQHDPAAATPAQEPVLPAEPEGEEAQPVPLPTAVVEVPAAEGRTAEDRVTEPASATETQNEVAPSEPTPAESVPGDVGLAVESPKAEIPVPGPVDPEPSPARTDEPAPSRVVGPPAEVDAEPAAAPAMVLPERPVRERLFYLGAGLGLLLAAALLVVWRFYRPRRRAHASVISQSMNRR